MKTITTCTFLVALLASANAANAGSINIFLDEEHQAKGNKGEEFRPVDVDGSFAGFILTSRSSLDNSNPFDADANGLLGTIYIDKDGAGVQTSGKKGSKGISGGGGHKDEELVFNYDNAVVASSIRLGLIDFKPGQGLNRDDDTILFVRILGKENSVMLDEKDYLDAFVSTGSKTGWIDFSLLGFGDDTLIESLAVRETNGHIEVNSMAYSTSLVPLPAPLLLGIAGLAGMGIVRKRVLR